MCIKLKYFILYSIKQISMNILIINKTKIEKFSYNLCHKYQTIIKI